MKQVYQCEYCDKILENSIEMNKHEKECGSNPKNRIDDEIVIKLSRIYEHFKDGLIYVLLEDFDEKTICFYEKEFERATRNNCPASIFENKKELKSIFIDVNHFRNNETKYFKDITRRDNFEFINSIRTFLREPEFRTNKEE